MEGGKLGLVGGDEEMISMKMRDECETQIEWEHILDDVPDQMGLDDFFDVGLGVGSTGSVDSWFADLENLLLTGDECNNNDNSELKGDGVELQVDDFQMCDLLLLDSPLHHQEPHSLSTEEPNLFTNKPKPNTNEIDVALDLDSKHDDNHDDNDDDNDDSPDNEDPLSKKRKRQLRNRDAAMRSRERRKMYVKELETKSRYLEAECRRLGRMLQCCYAENQMLRFSVHSATTFGDSMAKPESAVLLPETLPLVSLVWLMGLMWLHPLASLLLLSQDAAAVASINRKELESAAGATRVKGAKPIEEWPPPSYLRSKGCKASRTKMKFHFDSVQCPCLKPPLSFSHSTPSFLLVC